MKFGLMLFILSVELAAWTGSLCFTVTGVQQLEYMRCSLEEGFGAINHLDK